MMAAKICIGNDSVGELRTCSICSNTFSKPKILPCIHTFCLSCLEKTRADKQPGESMSCPLCKTEFVIPNAGLCALPLNLFRDKLLQQGTMSSAFKRGCSICETVTDDLRMYCIQCEGKLCEQCYGVHQRRHHHTIVDLKNPSRLKHFTQSSTLSYNTICFLHRSYMQMYCCSCEILICSICSENSHKSHTCWPIKKFEDDSRKQMLDQIEKMSNSVVKYGEYITGLEQRLNQTSGEITQTEKTIKLRSENLKRIIDKHTDKVLHELELIKKGRQEEIKITKQDFVDHQLLLDSLELDAVKILLEGPAVETYRSVHDISKQVRDLQNNHNTTFNQFQRKSFRVNFKESILEKFWRIEERNIVGNIVGELEDLTRVGHFPNESHDGHV